MRMLIAIPSKARAQTIAKKTMAYVPHLGIDYRVFVEPQDYDSYAVTVGEHALTRLDANDCGLGYAKVAMHDYAVMHGYEAIFKLDDDIEFWSPGHGTAQSNRATTSDTLRRTLAQISDLLMRKLLVQAVGFTYKTFMHPNSVMAWSMNGKLQTAYVCRTESFASHPNISTFEDFYTTLSIWVNGGVTMRYARAGMALSGGKYIGLNTGGLQCFDRKLLAEAEIGYFRALFPPLKIKRVDRPWGIEPDMAAARRELNKQYPIESEYVD